MRVAAILMLAMVFGVGCASGGGKQIAKGAVRGASHGVIEDVGKSNMGRGAAHGALGATHQVVDQNRAAK
jgi:hypothetical protein